MTEQSRHSCLPLQGGAIELHKIPAHAAALNGEVVDAPGQLGFAGAAGAHEQHGLGGAQGHLFDPGNELVEGLILRINPGFEKGDVILGLLFETAGQLIITRQFQINHLIGSGCILIFSPGRGALNQLSRKMA